MIFISVENNFVKILVKQAPFHVRLFSTSAKTFLRELKAAFADHRIDSRDEFVVSFNVIEHRSYDL